MDNPNCSTEHRKGQHLTAEERHDIEVHLKDDWSIYKIAKHLNRPYNTIKNEIRRGTVALYHGKVFRYKANEGQQQYCENRRSSTRKYRCLEVAGFLKYVVKKFREQGWSLDACVGNALLTGQFPREKMVCAKTLYNYVDLGLLSIKNIDLPEKLRRNTKAKRVRENRKDLGRSIEERPKSVEARDDIGHWEFDSVLGKKGADEPCALTMVERMTRNAMWLKVKNHSAEAVTEAIQELKNVFGTHFSKIFKTITTDNGSEFAELSTFETDETKVYFTHPFSSWEKGTNAFLADRINALPSTWLPHSGRAV